MEKALNGPEGANGIRYEVIALGSSGTGHVEHSKVLRERAMAYDPDLVLMTLASNDFCDDDPQLKEELVLHSGAISPGLRRLVSHGFFAAAFALKRVEDIRRSRVGICPEFLQWSREDIPRIETAWARTLDLARSSRDFCEERGKAFGLVYLGSELEVKYGLNPDKTLAGLRDLDGSGSIAWDVNKSVRRVGKYCEEHGIVLFSLLDALIAAQRETGNYVFGDHYTMFGHQVAARILTEAVNYRMAAHSAEKAQYRHTAAPGRGAAVTFTGGLVKRREFSAVAASKD
jgi:hypothetical protein